MIVVKPPVTAAEVRQRIEEAFKRSADIDAKRVSVEAHNGTVVLKGTVHSLSERAAAEHAAWPRLGASRSTISSSSPREAMTGGRKLRVLGRGVVAGAGLAAASYGAYAAVAWLRYGKVAPPPRGRTEDLLDHFMPIYEIVERHQIRVAASSEMTFRAASELDLGRSEIVRLIFRARERIMRSRSIDVPTRQPFLTLARSIGWGVLAERPGHEIVMGAVTQPWLPDVVFRPLPPEQFARFDDPGYVKIAWNLRVDSLDDANSEFRTETRAVATDPIARSKFRRYWSLVSPGIIIIRRLMMRQVRADGEREARAGALRSSSTHS